MSNTDATAPETMLLTRKHRLNLEKRHHRAFEAILERARQLENAALAERIEAYRKMGPQVIGHIRRDREAGIARIADDAGTVHVRRRTDLPPKLLADLIADEDRILSGLKVKRRVIDKDADVSDPALSAIAAGEGAVMPVMADDRQRKAIEGRLASTFGVGEVDQSRSLTKVRADDPAYAGDQRRIQRQSLHRLDLAMQAFFRRASEGHGFPQFKEFERFTSFGFDAWAQIKLDVVPRPEDDTGTGAKRRRPRFRATLNFAGMPGGVRVYLDRALPEVLDSKTGTRDPQIKNVWFKGDLRRAHGRGFNRWYTGLQCRVEIATDRKGCGSAAVGVDWGTSVLAALSTGETISNPRHGEALADDLTRAQRKVARARKGSKGRLKARRQLQAVQRKTANRRRNTMDKVSKRLVTHFGTIASEVVEARKMMDAERPGETLPEHVKRRRNREALDAAPYLLRQMTGYKARLYAARHVEIDPKARTSREASDGLALQPTQRCSYCGGLHFKELTDAEHVCTAPGPYWSMRLPRKVNAAKVILQAASGRFGIEIPSLAEGDRGGPVPGGLSGGDTVVRNGRTGARRPGNTEEGQPSPGRRSRKEPPIAADSGTHARRHPKTRPRRDAGW